MSLPPSARDDRSRDPEPSEPHEPGPRVKICSSSCLSWLHFLKSWSLRQSRGGSKSSDVVLVHGAWADGSSWAKVIPLLTAKGHSVTALQLPLTSLGGDVATVKRAIALSSGRIILVGHSYG